MKTKESLSQFRRTLMLRAWGFFKRAVISMSIAHKLAWAVGKGALREGEEDKNEPQRLFMTHAVLLLCRSRKSRLIDWALLWAWLTHQDRKLPIPDFAYDKHNEKGRQLKRGWGHFFREGTNLVNHTPQDKEEIFRERVAKSVSDPGGMGLF